MAGPYHGHARRGYTMTYKGVVRLLVAGVLVLCLLSPVWAKGPPSAQDDGKGKANGQTKLKGWRFAVFGDHRGDNKAYNVTLDGYKDGGFNKAVLADLATAIKGEDVEFALDVGDLVTKYKINLKNTTADVLLTKELADWAVVWNTASGNLPIYPVRGNQEVTASNDVWRAFTGGMPGIGDLAPNGPPGEEGLTFAFTHKNCLFVGIDQYADPLAHDPVTIGNVHWVSAAAQAWLDALLAASDRPHTFVIGHTPAYETWDSSVATPFTTIKDGMATPNAKFTLAAIAMRDAFWSGLGLVGAEYFCGHEHLYGRGVTTEAAAAVLRQTIIGNGGAPMVPVFAPAYDLLGVYCESYTGIVLPGIPPVTLIDPLIATEASAQTTQVGYIVIQVHGASVTAKYVAAPAKTVVVVEDGIKVSRVIRTGPFAVQDTWTIAEGDDEEEIEEPEEEEAEAATP